MSDGRLFLAQIPTVALHPSVMAALAIPEHSIASVTHLRTGQSLAAWVVGDDDPSWAQCPTPWSSTIRPSLAVWRALGDEAETRSGDWFKITGFSRAFPVWPAHIERLLAGNEIGMHKCDAEELGIKKWALVNHGEIPAIYRVRLSTEERDRRRVRLSYQARMLLGIVDTALGRPEIMVSPLPTDHRGRHLRVPEPRWASPRGRTLRRRRPLRVLAFGWERAVAWALGAPRLAFRTVEAAPGEDQALTVRIPEELFPLLGTQPGQQVYLEWGPRNRTVATALIAYEPEPGDWPSVRMIGRRPRPVAEVPALAKLYVGAQSRAALGTPRVTVVTVRRRVTPLIVGRLNELIIPATAVAIALTADIKLKSWELLGAMSVVVILLLVPLRRRRNPRGRTP